MICATHFARDVDVINLQVTSDPDDMNLWTDYLGETPLLDYQVEYVDEWHSTVTERRTYLAGFGAQAYQDLPGGETFYLHSDLIGSSVLTTEEAGTPGDTFAYTAFGEPIGPGGVGVPPANGPRYRYAGAWGYESDLLELQGPDQTLPPIALLHVGWRWYQPSIGRFVQRDPIGLGGGLNLYEYAGSDPLTCVDPLGLEWVTTGPWWARWLVNATGGTTGSSGYSNFWDNRGSVTSNNVGAGAAVVGVGAAGAAVCVAVGPAVAAVAPGLLANSHYVYDKAGRVVGKIVDEYRMGGERWIVWVNEAGKRIHQQLK